MPVSSPRPQSVFSGYHFPPEREFKGEMSAFRIGTQDTHHEPGTACLSECKEAISDTWVKSKGQRRQRKAVPIDQIQDNVCDKESKEYNWLKTLSLYFLKNISS